MYIFGPPLLCSKCGSRKSEFFSQGNIQGTRCLNCGHELKAEITTTSKPGDPFGCWQATAKANYF